MNLQSAREVAQKWVQAEAASLPDFYGAFYHGSTNGLPGGAILPATSDLDIIVVLDRPDPPEKPGKFLYQGVLLEVSYLSSNLLETPEQVLSSYPLAGSLSVPSVISDPSGQLGRIQSVVSREFARRHWVRKRCEGARNRVLSNLDSLDESRSFHDQVTSWLFATGVTTHILLVAGLKNPTVRRRYAAVRELLIEYGVADFYTTLLETLGCERMSPEQAEQHLSELTEAFDAASEIDKTPSSFISDLSRTARPIAIDGSRELIEQGCHREAIFWMMVTYCRIQKTLYTDALVEVQERFTPGFRKLAGSLGIASFADIERRSVQIREILPAVWEKAETIMAAHPGIEKDDDTGPTH